MSGTILEDYEVIDSSQHLQGCDCSGEHNAKSNSSNDARSIKHLAEVKHVFAIWSESNSPELTINFDHSNEIDSETLLILFSLSQLPDVVTSKRKVRCVNVGQGLIQLFGLTRLDQAFEIQKNLDLMIGVAKSKERS